MSAVRHYRVTPTETGHWVRARNRVGPKDIAGRCLEVWRRSALSADAFCATAGIKRNCLEIFERYGSTSSIIVFAIIRAFNVNENWMLWGEGRMYRPLLSRVLDIFRRRAA